MVPTLVWVDSLRGNRHDNAIELSEWMQPSRRSLDADRPIPRTIFTWLPDYRVLCKLFFRAYNVRDLAGCVGIGYYLD